MPTPEQYQRAENLRTYVRQEIEDLKEGKIDKLLTLKELSARFGYRNPLSASSTLSYRGLRQERTLAKSELRCTFPASVDSAWMIGILAGGGVVEEGGTIALRSNDTNLREVFRLRGENLFVVPAQTYTEHITHKGREKEKSVIKFYSKKMAKALGDLRRDRWTDTVLAQHRWILEQDRYSWSFLEGFFEERGHITTLHTLSIHTPSRASANFIVELMVRLGLKNPHVEQTSDPRYKEGVTGVVLYNLADIVAFAEYIHPASSEKAAILEQFKSRELQVSPVGRILYADKQVIEEYEKIRVILDGHITSRRIKRLNMSGESKISPQTYARRFGRGSFVKARENLERIVAEQRGRLRISPDQTSI